MGTPDLKAPPFEGKDAIALAANAKTVGNTPARRRRSLSKELRLRLAIEGARRTMAIIAVCLVILAASIYLASKAADIPTTPATGQRR